MKAFYSILGEKTTLPNTHHSLNAIDKKNAYVCVYILYLHLIDNCGNNIGY